MYTHFFTRLSSLSQKNLLDSFTSFCSFSLFNFQGPACHLLGDSFLIISHTFPFVNNFFIFFTSFSKLLCVFCYPSQDSLFIIPPIWDLSTLIFHILNLLWHHLHHRQFLYYTAELLLCQQFLLTILFARNPAVLYIIPLFYIISMVIFYFSLSIIFLWAISPLFHLSIYPFRQKTALPIEIVKLLTII